MTRDIRTKKWHKSKGTVKNKKSSLAVRLCLVISTLQFEQSFKLNEELSKTRDKEVNALSQFLFIRVIPFHGNPGCSNVIVVKRKKRGILGLVCANVSRRGCVPARISSLFDPFVPLPKRLSNTLAVRKYGNTGENNRWHLLKLSIFHRERTLWQLQITFTRTFDWNSNSNLTSVLSALSKRFQRPQGQ